MLNARKISFSVPIPADFRMEAPTLQQWFPGFETDLDSRPIDSGCPRGQFRRLQPQFVREWMTFLQDFFEVDCKLSWPEKRVEK